jgi:hypothetical protein
MAPRQHVGASRETAAAAGHHPGHHRMAADLGQSVAHAAEPARRAEQAEREHGLRLAHLRFLIADRVRAELDGGLVVEVRLVGVRGSREEQQKDGAGESHGRTS